MAQLRVGLVGAGGVGVRHAATLATLDDVRLVAVTDPDRSRAAAVADQHGAQVCPDLDALVDAGLDAVWLCLPPFARGAPERALVAAGVPFFVEKPLAVDLETAVDIAAQVAGSGLLTATGYHWRCLPGVARAAEVLAQTPAQLGIGSWLGSVPPVPWWSRRALSGGQVVEQATHLLDVMRLLVGEPEWVAAGAGAAEAGADASGELVDSVTSALLRFDTGAVATLSATSLLTWKLAPTLTLIGPDLAVEINEEATTIRHGDRVEVIADDGVAKRRVDADFCAAVRRGDPSVVSAPYAEALRTHRVGIAVAASARSGSPVQLPADVDG